MPSLARVTLPPGGRARIQRKLPVGGMNLGSYWSKMITSYFWGFSSSNAEGERTSNSFNWRATLRWSRKGLPSVTRQTARALGGGTTTCATSSAGGGAPALWVCSGLSMAAVVSSSLNSTESLATTPDFSAASRWASVQRSGRSLVLAEERIWKLGSEGPASSVATERLTSASTGSGPKLARRAKTWTS